MSEYFPDFNLFESRLELRFPEGLHEDLRIIGHECFVALEWTDMVLMELCLLAGNPRDAKAKRHLSQIADYLDAAQHRIFAAQAGLMAEFAACSSNLPLPAANSPLAVVEYLRQFSNRTPAMQMADDLRVHLTAHSMRELELLQPKKPHLLAALDRDLMAIYFRRTEMPEALPTKQRSILDLLQGRALSLKEMAKELDDCDPSHLQRDHLKPLMAAGHVKNNPKVGGYYRPTSPP
ncbi:MAG: hypothetical protein U0791_09990 [Gemmataceae bacterium]